MPFDPTAARSSAVLSTNPAYVGAWVCYINGLEVPITGWQVNYGVGDIPQATINVFPERCMERLGHEDRLQIALFYMDHWASDKSEPRLLFDGEIVGWGYANTGSSRTLYFTCAAHITLFQQLYFQFMNSMEDIVAAGNPEVRGSSVLTAGFAYPYQLFHQGLIGAPTTAGTNGQPQTTSINTVPGPTASGAPTPAPTTPSGTTASGSTTTPAATPPGTTASTASVRQGLALEGDLVSGNEPMIRRPFDLVYNVIAGLISNQVPPSRRTAPMINFFARHVRKTRFNNRWVAMPLLEDPEVIDAAEGVFPILRAARANEALVAMQNHAAGRAGPAGPVWNLLQEILGNVLMEICCLPTAPCVLTELSTGKILQLLHGNDPLVEQHGRALVQQAEEDARNDWAESMASAAYGISALGSGPAPGQSQAEWNAQVAAANANLANLAAHPAGTPGAIHASASEVAAGRDEGRARSQLGTPSVTPVRLAQYFVKPPLFFAIPPKCNVFYPSMIETWGYDENYLSQPTRTYVNDSLMSNLLQAQGANANFIVQALSVGWPEEADRLMRQARGVDASGQLTGSAANGQRETGKNLLIFPEEFFKGPIIERMGLPPWFQMLQQMANGRSRAPDTETGTADNSQQPGVIAIRPTSAALTAQQITNWPLNRPGWQRGHPTVYAASKIVGGSAFGQSVNIWWYSGRTGQGMVGHCLRTMCPLLFNVPPTVFLGFAANAWQLEHAAWGHGGHTDIGYLGIDAWDDGTLREGCRYYPLLASNEAKACIQAATGTSRFPSGPTWPHPALADIPGQMAAGLVNLRNRGREFIGGLHFGARNQATSHPPRAIRQSGGTRGVNATPATATPEQTAVPAVDLTPTMDEKGGRTLWYIALVFMGWSAGRTGTINIIKPYASRIKEASNNDESRYWATFVKLLYEDAINGRQRSVDYMKWHPYMYTVGTLQKIEIGRTIAHATRTDMPFYEEHFASAEERAKIYNCLTLFAYRPYATALATINQMYPGTVQPSVLVQANAQAAVDQQTFMTRDQQNPANARPTRATVPTPVNSTTAPPARVDPAMAASQQQAPSTTQGAGGTTPSNGVERQVTTVRTGAPLPPNPAQPVTATPPARPPEGTPAPATTTPAPAQEVGRLEATGSIRATSTTPTPSAGAAATAPTATPQIQTETMVTPEAEPNSPRAFADLFRNYAQHAFFTSRYEKRRATVNLAFNPYVVPGFPCVILDRMTAEHHAVAYVQKVSHSGSADGQSAHMKTTVNVSHARTMSEFLYNIQQDATRFGAVTLTAPAEVIDEIREVVQDRNQAATFYRRLFYGDEQQPERVIFNFMEEFVYETDQGRVVIEQDGPELFDAVEEDRRVTQARGEGGSFQANPTEQPATAGQAATGTTSMDASVRRLEHNVDPNQRLAPAPAFAAAWDQYDAAMRQAARPICTLAQYIRFWHGGRPIEDLERSGQIVRGTGEFNYAYTADRNLQAIDNQTALDAHEISRPRRATAEYWERIYLLRPGPGEFPPDGVTRYTPAPAPDYYRASETLASLDANAPQTRADWDTALRYYRTVVRQRLAPGQ